MSDQEVIRTPISDNIEEIEAPHSKSIRSLEQLLEAGRVDQKTWKVLQWNLNTWESAAKRGSGDDAEWMVQDLWQVKATLIRKKMVAQFPIVRPLKVERTVRQVKASQYRRPQGIETTLIVPDMHIGFVRDPKSGELEPLHDMRAMDVVLQVAAELRPHNLIILGDVLDLAEWSTKFLSSPDFEQTTQPAVIAANWYLGALHDVTPGSRAVVLEGNHDKRVETALLTNMKAAYGLRPADELALPPAMSVPRLLALHKLGYAYSEAYPNGEYWLSDGLYCQHGNVARKGGGKSTAAVIKDLDVSAIFGHIHRLEQAMRTTFSQSDTRTIGAYACGCLCRIDGIVPGTKARQDWQQGFGVCHTTPDGQATVQLYEISKGRSLFGNKLFVGEDRTAVLREDTGWNFAAAG
jgi:hypothetical protein